MAFTLAEVLITLGVIGIVAALTLPTLIKNYQKTVLLNQLKKTYAVLNQGVLLMKAKYDTDPVGMPFVHEKWNHKYYLDSSMFGPEFAEHIAVDWHGSDPQNKLCFLDVSEFNYKYMNGNNIQPQSLITQTPNNYTWQLRSGACVEFAYGRNWEWDGTDTRRFVIDVNGSYKGPNVKGKDLFFFVFEPDGKIVPEGLDATPKTQYDNCRSGGTYCAAMIFKAGMKYPHNYPW